MSLLLKVGLLRTSAATTAAYTAVPCTDTEAEGTAVAIVQVKLSASFAESVQVLSGSRSDSLANSSQFPDARLGVLSNEASHFLTPWQGDMSGDAVMQ